MMVVRIAKVSMYVTVLSFTTIGYSLGAWAATPGCAKEEAKAAEVAVAAVKSWENLY